MKTLPTKAQCLPGAAAAGSFQVDFQEQEVPLSPVPRVQEFLQAASQE